MYGILIEMARVLYFVIIYNLNSIESIRIYSFIFAELANRFILFVFNVDILTSTGSTCILTLALSLLLVCHSDYQQHWYLRLLLSYDGLFRVTSEEFN